LTPDASRYILSYRDVPRPPFPAGLGRRHDHRPGAATFATASLLLLAEDSRNGYQLMQEIEERSGGRVAPEPRLDLSGRLQQLEDEGLIRSEEVDGRKPPAPDGRRGRRS